MNYHQNNNKVIGIVCIIFGCIGMLVVIGDLILRIFLALCALKLINYGLKLYGYPPLQLLFPRIMSFYWF